MYGTRCRVAGRGVVLSAYRLYFVAGLCIILFFVVFVQVLFRVYYIDRECEVILEVLECFWVF